MITPTFRRPGPLAEAIKSVLSQTGVNVDMLVIDDSPEGSARVVVEGIGDPRVRYRQMSPPTGGQPALVRNAGIAQATGKYVHFLDDDDIVAEGAYASMVAALEARPNVGVGFGRVDPFGDSPEKTTEETLFFTRAARHAAYFSGLPCSSRLMAGAMLYLGTLLVCSAGIIRRDCLLKTNGFDVECRVMEDVEFYTRALRRFGCTYLDRVVVRYRTGEPSLMNDLEDEQPIAGSYNRIYERYRAEFGATELFVLKVLMRTVFSRV